MRFYADVLVANHSYVADNNQKFVHNLESGMYGIVFDILHYRPVINTLAPKKLTTIIYEIKYAQSHFFDNNAILYHKSGNGILNNLRIKFAQSVILDMGHFYAKNYASTYSNPVYNCYATAKPEISVLSLGASYQKWTGKYHGNFYCGLSAYARIYQDFINSQFSYTVGANLVWFRRYGFRDNSNYSPTFSSNTLTSTLLLPTLIMVVILSSSPLTTDAKAFFTSSMRASAVDLYGS